jgi:hypothetical protein
VIGGEGIDDMNGGEGAEEAITLPILLLLIILLLI